MTLIIFNILNFLFSFRFCCIISTSRGSDCPNCSILSLPCGKLFPPRLWHFLTVNLSFVLSFILFSESLTAWGHILRAPQASILTFFSPSGLSLFLFISCAANHWTIAIEWPRITYIPEVRTGALNSQAEADKLITSLGRHVISSLSFHWECGFSRVKLYRALGYNFHYRRA